MSNINKKEYIEKYGEEAWKIKMNKAKQYRAEHAEKYKEIYNKYYQNHKDERKEKSSNYYRKHKDERKEIKKSYYKKYLKTKPGRANNLLSGYRRDDLKSNYGECTLTMSWIVDRIFSSSCVYCGDSDWEHLGCDRIDNTLPHTPENCICACGICNIEREYKEMSVDEFKKYRAANPRECDKQKRE